MAVFDSPKPITEAESTITWVVIYGAPGGPTVSDAVRLVNFPKLARNVRFRSDITSGPTLIMDPVIARTAALPAIPSVDAILTNEAGAEVQVDNQNPAIIRRDGGDIYVHLQPDVGWGTVRVEFTVATLVGV